MNCQELNSLLDEGSLEELGTRQKEAVEEHFGSCRACREGWAAYREISALSIPRTPQALRSRIMAAVAPTESPAIPRTVILGGLLAVGAAVAAAVAVQVGGGPDPAQPLEEPTPVAAAETTTRQKPAPAAIDESEDSLGAAHQNEPSDPESNAIEYALDPNSIVVLPVPEVGLEPHQVAMFRQFYDELLRQLRAVPDLNVVHPDIVAPFLAASMPEEEIAHDLGAATLVLFSTTLEPNLMLSYMVVDSTTGASKVSGTYYFRSGQRWPGTLESGVAEFVANIESARSPLTPSRRDTAIADARATVLNAALPTAKRVEALGRLPQTAEGRNDAIVAAALELATIAPAFRGSIWRAMYGVDNPYLIDPLLDSLTYDTAEYTRRAAAAALETFLAEARVRAALERAQATDPSQAVREGARHALATEEGRDQLALEKLLDETLPPKERLNATTIHEGRNVRSVQLTEEAAQAVFDIGVNSTDAGTRARAWSSLGRNDVYEPRFATALLYHLANHPNERVRSTAANALTQYISDPAVRAALEQAESDASFQVRQAVRRALGKIPR